MIYGSGDHRDLHVLTRSCPTRLSSDLFSLLAGARDDRKGGARPRREQPAHGDPPQRAAVALGIDARSEEHTSELQSLMRNLYAVFCLKKKTTRREVQHLAMEQLMQINNSKYLIYNKECKLTIHY